MVQLGYLKNMNLLRVPTGPSSILCSSALVAGRRARSPIGSRAQMAHTALVTGATGYVATELVSQLLQKASMDAIRKAGDIDSVSHHGRCHQLRALVSLKLCCSGNAGLPRKRLCEVHQRRQQDADAAGARRRPARLVLGGCVIIFAAALSRLVTGIRR